VNYVKSKAEWYQSKKYTIRYHWRKAAHMQEITS